MRSRQLLAALSATAWTLAACSSGASPSSPASPTPSAPATTAGTAFVARVDNPYFPVLAGTRWVYTGTKDSKAARDVVTVPGTSTVIHGVRCIDVKDTLYLDGVLEERTTDWYVQDTLGNVWYYGEDTAEVDEQGKVVSTEGTWRAGRDGARPGIFMPASPTVGASYRQEYYRGHAEDHFKVISLTERISAPGVAPTTGMLTQEWTPLEPDVLDQKYYAKGVGTVIERSVKGPLESLTLVSFTPGH